MKPGWTFRLPMSSMSVKTSRSVKSSMNVTGSTSSMTSVKSPISMASRWCLVASVLLVLVLCGAKPSPAGQYVLPDTGQTKCYDDVGHVITCPSPEERFYGQDGNYQRAQLAFKDNGDGTVTDLNTSLMWQKGDDQNSSGRNWQDAVSYCEALDLGGYTDWRLPTVHELKSILNYGTYNPAIDRKYFTRCRSAYYWSGTPNASSTYGVWVVGFSHGGGDWDEESSTLAVRCARGGP